LAHSITTLSITIKNAPISIMTLYIQENKIMQNDTQY
jgi:hypothetical protein